jgi:SHS2 domain-containing protein
MELRGYSEIDHTADLALRVWGEEFFALLALSVEGMYDLMGVTINKGVRIDNQIVIEESTPETMLVDFLAEMLYQAQDNRVAYSEFGFGMKGEDIRVQAEGHPIQQIERAIKAVTYHDLSITTTENGLETTITFDV